MNSLLITGSSGFIGEKLASTADALGFNVIGIDLKESSNLKCQQYKLNIAVESLQNYLSPGATIVHLASISNDSLCKQNPISAVDVNLRATALITEAANLANAKHLIFASSEWVYPEIVSPKDQFETDSLTLKDLTSFYALSKLMGESIIQSTATIPYSLLRFGIVYGPRVIPGSSPESLAQKIYKGEEIVLGSKETARRFIYINDLIDGILKVVQHGSVSDDGTALNLTGQKLISLSEIVTSVGNIMNKTVSILDKGKLPSIRNPSNARANSLIDWKPKYDFRDGITECIAFNNYYQELEED